MTNYTGFSSIANQQSGHYLAIRVDNVNASDTVAVELIGGTVGHPVTLDADRNIVLRIAEPNSQKVKVTVNGGNAKTYSLTGLTLEPADDMD